jgi:hypothetical protein
VERAQRKYINREWYKDLKNPPLTFLRSSKPYFDRITMRALKKLFVFLNLRIKKKLDGPTDFFTDEEVTQNDGIKGNNNETN